MIQTGGKDRTGIAAAIILGLAGADHKQIAAEYALSRIGIEPGRKQLTSKLTGGKAVDMQSDIYQKVAKIESVYHRLGK